MSKGGAKGKVNHISASEQKLAAPALSGSEKQVAWANEIRQNYIAQLNKALSEGHVGIEDIESARSHSTIKLLSGRKTVMRTQSEDEIADIILKAKEAKKSARTLARQQGKPREEITIAGIKAESEVCSPVYKKWVQSDIMEVGKASDWIDAYKFDTLYVPINQSLALAIRTKEEKKKYGGN